MLTRVTEFTRAVEQVKVEVGQMLDQRDEQWRKEQREAERTRQLEIGAVKEETARLGEGIRPLARVEERLNIMQAEEGRLNETLQRLDAPVTDLDKSIEDRMQTVIYLEEQRRADHQRLQAMEMEVPELRQRLESFGAKLPLLEEGVQKQRARIDEGLRPIREFEKVVEEMRVADFRRNQDVKKWLGQAEEVRAEVERLREERQRFVGDYRDIQEATKRLEAFQGRLEVRQNEVTEMQRIADERLKRQWEEWQGKQEKAWRNWEVGSEERWRVQQRTNESLQKQLGALVPVVKLHQAQIGASWEILRSDAARTFKTAQDEYEALIADIDEQLTTLRDQIRQQEA